MLNTFTPSLPSSPSASDLKTLGELIELCASPVEARDRVEQLKAAADAARKWIGEAEKVSAGLKAEIEQVNVELAEARRIHEAAIAKDREQFDANSSKRAADHDRREKQIAASEATTASEAKRATELRTDLEKRLQGISEIARI